MCIPGANADCTLTVQLLSASQNQGKKNIFVGWLLFLRETFQFRTYATWRSPIDFDERLVFFSVLTPCRTHTFLWRCSQRGLYRHHVRHRDFTDAQTCPVFVDFVAGLKSNCCVVSTFSFFIQCECPISQIEQTDWLTLSTNPCVTYCTLICGSK